MATNFPEDLDNLLNPASTDSMTGHAAQHANANDAIEALQTKVGIDNSEDPNSLDYRIAAVESGLENATGDFIPVSDVGVAGGVASLNSAAKVPVEQIPALGLEGNNDVTIYGIENKTEIDSFSKSLYGTVRYVMQVIKGSEIISTAIDIVNDQSNLYVQEVEVSSNTTNELATHVLEENAGIISLSVTPISGSVSVRYYRTALKI
jgi:hypothetical protein